MDPIFSANTLVELKLGDPLYAQHFARVLKPGGYVVVDYVDPTTDEGWRTADPGRRWRTCTRSTRLRSSTASSHRPGVPVERRHQVGKSTFVIARRV
jgi:hypothetical protein